MKEMRLAYLLGLNACNTTKIIMHPNGRAIVVSFTGHVIIIYDGHLVKSVSVVLAWRSLQTLKDLLFLASWRAKNHTGPLDCNRYNSGPQNRTQEIQGTCNELRMAGLMWITIQFWQI